jgi:aryl-alcohol dehydrogenase-like predicted oxidoreductase
VLGQGEDVIPIPGTKKRKYLEENAASVNIVLPPAVLQEIGAVLLKYPHTGARYSEGTMKLVNN